VNDRFLKACRREPVDRTPVWLMRQAGRYLPEYRELRADHDFLTLTRTPELAAEVTLQPIRRFGFDAAILFADILTPLVGHGVEVEFAPGPVLAKPIRTGDDVDALRDFDAAAAVPETLETIRILKEKLDVPLIGFVGAPFTLACYLVDGKGTKDFPLTRGLLYREPDLANDLLETVSEMVARYALAQIEAGADAVQVFDTWADLLGPRDGLASTQAHLAGIHRRIREAGVPSIHYSSTFSTHPEFIEALDCDVVGVDWRIDIAEARARADRSGKAVQGNLDPLCLFGSPDVLRDRLRDLLRAAGSEPGHVFNLGHGIHKDTPIESVELLVDFVREETSR